MPKIIITEEVGQKLKEFRINHNIKSKDVAEQISKTAAYFSKLEKGDIKTIEKSVFEDILNFITNTNNGYNIFMESVSLSLTPEELEDNLAFQNFDSVERKIPVSAALIDDINFRIKSLDIKVAELVDYINKNEDLGEDFLVNNGLTLDKIKYNHWYSYDLIANNVEDTKSFIIINLDFKAVEDLLNKRVTESNWITILSIMYHLLKLENKNGADIKTLQIEANNILIKYKFYSLFDRASLAQQSKTEEEYNELLNDFDKENREYVNIILSAIAFISDYDVKYANKLLKKIANNIKADASFALSFMATDVSELKDSSVTAKKSYLKEITQIIDKTKLNSSNQIEIFD